MSLPSIPRDWMKEAKDGFALGPDSSTYVWFVFGYTLNGPFVFNVATVPDKKAREFLREVLGSEWFIKEELH